MYNDKIEENLINYHSPIDVFKYFLGGAFVKRGKFELSKAYKPLYTKGGEEEKTEKVADPAKNILDYLHDFVTLLSAVLLVLLLLLRVVVVSGPSMKNTLIDGDYIILLSNVFYSDPSYGDVVVASKESFKDGEPIIKRIIATEGQTVDIDFNAGIVYVDGVALEEPYTLTDTNLQEGIQFPLTVEKGCVFVMGDNRNESKDSRNPEIGQIDRREILGKAAFLIFPGENKETEKRDFTRIGVLS